MAGEVDREKERLAQDLAKRYWDFISEIPVGEGPALWIPYQREKIAEAGVSTPEIEELDEIVVEEALAGSLSWLKDDETQPLEKWWYHLRKIATRRYPSDLLPEHLRRIYLEEASSLEQF